MNNIMVESVLDACETCPHFKQLFKHHVAPVSLYSATQDFLLFIANIEKKINQHIENSVFLSENERKELTDKDQDKSLILIPSKQEASHFIWILLYKKLRELVSSQNKFVFHLIDLVTVNFLNDFSNDIDMLLALKNQVFSENFEYLRSKKRQDLDYEQLEEITKQIEQQMQQFLM